MKQKRSRNALTEESISILCRQLSMMLSAGVSPETACSLLAEEIDVPHLQKILTQLYQKLAVGMTLPQAMEETGEIPEDLIRMLEIGQASGHLERVLAAQADYYQREWEIRQSLKRMVAYPAFMGVLVAAVFLVLAARVLPVFQDLFSQMGITLSPVAMALLRVGNAGRGIAVALAVLLVAGSAALLWIFRTNAGWAGYMKWFSRSEAGQAMDRSRFASAMSLMLSSGIPVDESMSRTAHMLENSGLAPKVRACQEKLDQGGSIAAALQDNALFSGAESGLLAAGTKAGIIDQVMDELARRSRERADEKLNQRVRRFEYILVIVLCLAVGVLLLSVMIPLLGALSALGG